MKCLGFHLNSNNLRLSPCGNLQLVTVKAQSFVHSDLVEKKEPRIDPCNKVVVATMELLANSVAMLLLQQWKRRKLKCPKCLRRIGTVKSSGYHHLSCWRL